jgi:hypothetical protein
MDTADEVKEPQTREASVLHMDKQHHALEEVAQKADDQQVEAKVAQS